MRNMATSPSPRGIAAIVGVGAKLGRSIARKFAHEGYTVAILARDLGQFTQPIYWFPHFCIHFHTHKHAHRDDLEREVKLEVI